MLSSVTAVPLALRSDWDAPGVVYYGVGYACGKRQGIYHSYEYLYPPKPETVWHCTEIWMKYRVFTIIGVLVAGTLLNGAVPITQERGNSSDNATNYSVLQIFIDCTKCDTDYLRNNINFANLPGQLVFTM